jgi:hypothetical protein
MSEAEPYVAPGPLSFPQAPQIVVNVPVDAAAHDDNVISRWVVPVLQALITGGFTATAAYLALGGVRQSIRSTLRHTRIQLRAERARQRTEHENERLAKARELEVDRRSLIVGILGELKHIASVIAANLSNDAMVNAQATALRPNWSSGRIGSFGFECWAPFIKENRNRFGLLDVQSAFSLTWILQDLEANRLIHEQNVPATSLGANIVMTRQYRRAVANRIIEVWTTLGPNISGVGGLPFATELRHATAYDRRQDPLDNL